MSKKDFKEGMIAGAKPFEDKFREVQNANIVALQKLASENANEVGELIDIAEEHDYLLNYNWKQECQLGSLAEKSILIGFLMDAINKISTSDPSDTQKGFLNSIYRLLKLNISALFSKTIDISYLSNNNDVAFQKLLYLLTCMYFYLENENFEFEKNNPDVFNYFSVSPRDRKDIQGLINERGKYFDLDSLFAPIEEEVAEIEVPMEEEDDAVGCNLPDGLEEKCFDELYMVKKDCEEVIFDKIIHIQANLHVDGKMTFKNCKINAQDSYQINVTDSGVLEFDNCEFSKVRRTEKYLIDSRGKVNFNRCSIYNCWKIVESDGDVDDNTNDVEISKSIIKFDEKFSKVDGEFLCIDNTLFMGKLLFLCESKVEGFINSNGDLIDLGNNAIIFSGIKTCSKTTFFNCRQIFENQSNFDVVESSFNSCTNVFNYTQDIVVVESLFSNCSHIFEFILASENKIEKCKFLDCENQILFMGSNCTTCFDACEFRRLTQSFNYTSLFFVSNPLGSELKIKNCVFDSISLAEYGAIVRNGGDNPKDKSFVGEVSVCTFNNIIRTTDNPVIAEYSSYTGAFGKKHTYYAYSIHNCSGLDGLL